MRVEINRTNPDGRINTLSPGATKTEGLLAAIVFMALAAVRRHIPRLSVQRPSQ